MTSIVSLVLYGSCARGDLVEGSDLDVLAIAKQGRPLTVTHGGLQVSRYAVDDVVRRARAGDLFAFHLVKEGKVLYEREPAFAQVQRAFRLRADYTDAHRLASDVGWCLLHHRHRARDGLRFNQRMAWCTHTMMVARAADAGHALFSAEALAAFGGSSDIATVIRSKRSAQMDPTILNLFRGVLEMYGGPEPDPLATLSQEWYRFGADRNPAGAAAIHALLARRDGGFER